MTVGGARDCLHVPVGHVIQSVSFFLSKSGEISKLSVVKQDNPPVI